MPLSGPHGDQGKKLAELIKYGIEDHIQGFINTTTYDVATEDYTRQAIEKMIAAKTQIILGPLFSPSVKALESYVKNHNVIMLTLSNNPALAEPRQVYVMGHAPLKQSSRMISYLLSSGHTEFGLMIPKSKTSINLENVLREMITSTGANIFASTQYAQSKDDIKNSISKLATAVDENLEDMYKQNKPVIFVAEDNPDIIRFIFDEVSSLQLDSKAIISGDNRIDVPYSGNIKILFTGSNKVASNSLIEKTSQNLGISSLNQLENIAYDLGVLTSVAVGKTYTRDGFISRIESPIWNEGLSATFRFKDAASERKYSIIQRNGQSYKIVHDIME